jgi:hypothetical protein
VSARRKVWVLFHAYSDGSGKPEHLRVYLDEERAREDLALAVEPWGGADWHLVEAELFGLRERRRKAPA